MSERRARHQMPEDVREALEREGVSEDYEQRPAYQRNDYLGWIGAAKRSETRAKRLAQMIEELRQGGVYMKMEHAPSRKSAQSKTAEKEESPSSQLMKGLSVASCVKSGRVGPRLR